MMQKLQQIAKRILRMCRKIGYIQPQKMKNDIIQDADSSSQRPQTNCGRQTSHTYRAGSTPD